MRRISLAAILSGMFFIGCGVGHYNGWVIDISYALFISTGLTALLIRGDIHA
jgi:hypothetical protein